MIAVSFWKYLKLSIYQELIPMTILWKQCNGVLTDNNQLSVSPHSSVVIFFKPTQIYLFPKAYAMDLACIACCTTFYSVLIYHKWTENFVAFFVIKQWFSGIDIFIIIHKLCVINSDCTKSVMACIYMYGLWVNVNYKT